LGCHDRELSVLFTDNKHIAELNEQYLHRTGPTDVLSFPMSGGLPPEVETPMMGDVVVSVDTALEESRRLDEPLDKTIYRLLIHGILHLLGYDHEVSEEEEVRMEREQERLLRYIEEEES